MASRLASCLIVSTLMLAACDGDGDTSPTTAESSTTSTTTSSTSPTTSVAPTSTAAPTTAAPSTTAPPATSSVPPTTAAPTTCPAGPDVPAGADALTGVAVDLNADGQPDTLQTYVVPATIEWHVRVAWGGGGATDSVVAGVGGAGASRPIGEFDVEGDGTLEVFLTVGSGASTLLVGLYDVVGCDLVRVTTAGDPAVFPIGATVGNVSGLSCGPVGDLDRLFASLVAGDEWEGGFEPFTLSGSVLTAGTGDGATFTGAEAGALADLDCGALALP